MKKNQISSVLLLTALVVAGCSSKSGMQKDPNAMDSRPAQPAVVDNTQGSGINNNDINGSQFGSNTYSTIPAERVIYFDFDSSQIRAEAESLLQAHAAYLTANSNVIVRLEGHADERGSREYNLALGEQRAVAAKRMLNILGVSESQMTILSYGEEMPLDFGHSEASWQRNRRVEIVYP